MAVSSRPPLYSLRHLNVSGSPQRAAFSQRLSVERSRWNEIVKRAMDLSVGIPLCLVLLPLFALTALAVRMESPGPIFFSQLRRGKVGRFFKMWKFRSMRASADQEREILEEWNETDTPLFKMRRDPRITRVGRILRRYSIDELPQLLNVIRGEMSLVGPRPLPIKDIETQMTDPDMRYWIDRREDVPPGLTGLWQVAGRSEVGFQEMLALDLCYVTDWSLILDVEILARTIPAVLRGKGAY